MSFANLPFKERFAQMGDTSENAFKEWATKKGIKYVDYGLKRPPFDTFHDLPLYIRGQPDFICEGKGRRKFLVECKGSGGRVVKIKTEAMNALEHWNSDLTVWLFIFDSSPNNERIAFLPFRQLQEVTKTCQVRYFPTDNKPYYNIPANRLTWEKVEKDGIENI